MNQITTNFKVWTKGPDGCHCVNCGLTWDMHICDGKSSCPPSRIDSLSARKGSEKSASSPADHRGIEAARSSECGMPGRIPGQSIQSCEPVDSDTVSGGAGELEANDSATSVDPAPTVTPDVDEQLLRDQRAYGTSYCRIDADGTRTRIDPSTVMIAPQPEQVP